MNIITFIDLIFLFQREGGGKGGGDVSIFFFFLIMRIKPLEEGGTTSLV